MIRLLLLLLLFFLGYTLFQAVFRLLTGRSQPPSAPRGSRSPKSREGEEMVQDPQCGTFVPRGDAVSAVVRGKRRYFCSTACRDAYAGKS